MLLDLGLTRAEIKKLKYEEERVKKIIALQNKTKNNGHTSVQKNDLLERLCS